MEIRHHRLYGERVSRVPTAHTSGTIQPEIIVIHETGTSVKKGAAVDYLRRNDRKVSYHVVIERDGSVVQMADFDQRTHHAGRSVYKGRKWCNGFGIGIGLVGPGKLDRNGKSYFGTKFDDAVHAATSAHGDGWWLPYSDQQLDVLRDVIEAIEQAYGLALPVCGHYQVSPGRKVDPSPLLPIEPIDSQREYHAEEATETADAALSRDSTEYKAAKVGKALSAGGTTIYVGNEIGKALAPENVQATKTYFDLISSFISDYGIFALIGGMVATWAIFEFMQRRKRQSYDAGLYEPSGQVDTEPRP